MRYSLRTRAGHRSLATNVQDWDMVEIGDFAHVPGGNSLVECAIGKHQGHAKDTASVPAGYVTIERTVVKHAFQR